MTTDERDPRYEPTKREQARELYASGMSERAVAEHMELSRTRVRQLLAESGVKRRKRGRPVARRRTARHTR
jgi:DNA-binding transcriptional regulator LsrR (DeoR family)